MEIGVGLSTPVYMTCNTGEQASCHTLSDGFNGYWDEGVIYVTSGGGYTHGPEVFDVRVTFDGEELGHEVFELDWTASYPNGEECDPGCWGVDDEQMTIERPTVAD